jgi:tripartite-type tricarboxylate transporter receptor subunit TctC
VQIVAYKTSPDIVVAVLRNDVQLMIDFPPAAQGQVNDGKFKVLATSSPKRSPLMQSVPTVDEAGVKGYEVISWNGVGAPKDTPKEVIDTMNKAIREVMALSEVKEQYAKVGVVAQASTADELMDRLKSDIKKWNDVVDKAGIPRK